MCVGNEDNHILINRWNRDVPELIDDALGSFDVGLGSFFRPPIDQLSIFVSLLSLVVETVRDFVTDHEADASVVHVLGSVVLEENSLQDSRL